MNQCFSERWNFSKADWIMFTFISDMNMRQVEVIDDVDDFTENVSVAMVEAAKVSIAESRPGSKKQKSVPWWTDECTQAISCRNKAFKGFRNSLSFQKYLEYKREQAKVRKVIRKVKKDYWIKYCNTIGRQTSVNDVWRVVKKMSGVQQSWSYPVLKNGEKMAVNDEDKASLMVKSIANVHSSLNLTDDERHNRAVTKRQYQYLLENVEDRGDSMNASFSVSELKKAISKAKVTATGKDRISYAMLKHLSSEALNTVLELFNKILYWSYLIRYGSKGKYQRVGKWLLLSQLESQEKILLWLLIIGQLLCRLT